MQRHLHGHFHRHRAGIRIEDPVQARPQQRRQPPRQRQRRLVDQAAEHHVRHGVELGAHGPGDVGMVVTVAGGPPGRHPVDQAAPVGQLQPAAVAAHHGQRRRGGLHLGIGQPDVGLALATQSGVCIYRAPAKPEARQGPGGPSAGAPGGRRRLHYNGPHSTAWPPAAPGRPRICRCRSWIPFSSELALAETRRVRRRLRTAAAAPAGRIVLNGAPMLNFSSNDYLGLARHPLLVERAREWTAARRRRPGLATGLRQPGPARTGRGQAGPAQGRRGRPAAGLGLAGQRRRAARAAARRRRPGRGPALCRQAQPRQPAPRLPGRRREADPLPP